MQKGRRRKFYQSGFRADGAGEIEGTTLVLFWYHLKKMEK